jgi:hypothetical protein
MRAAPLLHIMLILLPCVAWAQPVLLPSIGIGALPADAEPICTLPFQTPPIQSVGRPAGEQAADFTLYDLDGNAFNLEQALLEGKPVLMISSSYTCPVFRNKVPLINSLSATYGAQLTIVIVYTPEAHPHLDISPYFGAVNTGQANINAGILYQQPTTYGERKAIVQDMLADLSITAPVFLDGPCNNWWNYYGPQPNNAYLITTGGTIFRHHDWLNKPPDDIVCDIHELLGLPPNCDQSFGGSFTAQLMGNDTIWGDAGTTLTGHVRLTNPTNEDCLVRIVKLQVNMPGGWASSLCADVCYLPQVDTAIVPLAANSTMDFYYYFYTTGPGTGYTRVGFRNENNFNNSFMRDFWGIASTFTGMDEHADASVWRIVPNPAVERITLESTERIDALLLFDAQGREVRHVSGRHADVSDLKAGMYMVQALRHGTPQGRPQRLVKQ